MFQKTGNQHKRKVKTISKVTESCRGDQDTKIIINLERRRLIRNPIETSQGEISINYLFNLTLRE